MQAGMCRTITRTCNSLLRMYPQVLRRVKDPDRRMFHWGLFGTFQLMLGLTLHFAGVAMNTGSLCAQSFTGCTAQRALAAMPVSQPLPSPLRPLDLYSISYTLVTGGTAGLLLTACFFFVDLQQQGAALWTGFKYMGMNAIVM